MIRVGYARVSTGDQDPELQLRALDEAGCERVFVDQGSGARDNLPQLAAALDYLRAGDQLVVYSLDRIGRRLRHLLEIADSLRARGVELELLVERVDTTTAQGRVWYSVLGAIAEYELARIRERTRAGLAAARAEGRLGGRPRALSDHQIRYARRALATGETTISELAAAFMCGRATVYRALADA